MDISQMLEPNSDQLDAIELIGGARVFTVERVAKNNNAEQPLNVHLAEFPRVWRPGKSMRRVLARCWGTDGAKWAGRRVELFCDPDVVFGKEKVGGTRISRLSHIDGPQRIPLLIARGKSATYVVEPLPDAPAARDWHAEADALNSIDALKALWREAPPDARDYINARAALLRAVEPEGHGTLDTEESRP